MCACLRACVGACVCVCVCVCVSMKCKFGGFCVESKVMTKGLLLPPRYFEVSLVRAVQLHFKIRLKLG